MPSDNKMRSAAKSAGKQAAIAAARSGALSNPLTWLAIGLVFLFLFILGLAFLGGLKTNQASACGTTVAPGSIAPGSNVANTKIAYTFLMSKGVFQPFQAAGILGNTIHESGGDGSLSIDTTAVNKTSGAWGIAQWLGGRLTALQHFQFQGRKTDDIYLQLTFMWQELTTTHRGALQSVLQSKDIASATINFEKTFEISGDIASYPGRIKNAEDVLAQFGNGATPLPVAGSLDGCTVGLGFTGVPGKVIIAPGANKIGQPVQPVTLNFLGQVAGVYGKPLVCTTGTNHDYLTVDGNVSDHSIGHACDIGMVANGGADDSPVGDAIATACLIAAGTPANQALQMARQGGLWTLYHGGLRIQCIWKTNLGGNHHDHVHMGAAPT